MNDLMQQNSPPLPFPLQHMVTQTVASTAATQERPELMTLWAGQSASLSHCGEASEFRNKLLAEVNERLLKLTRNSAKDMLNVSPLHEAAS
jgi:hypothetical protein